MIEIGFSTSFKRAYKKLLKINPEIENLFWERLNLFIENHYDKQLKTHKLSGKLKNLWSFSINFSIRIIFYYESEDKITLIDIGSHEEVY